MREDDGETMSESAGPATPDRALSNEELPVSGSTILKPFRRTLGQLGSRNAIGLGRLIFALLVVVSHVYVVGQLGGEPLLTYSRGNMDIGRLAVDGFFGFSGFLIVQSALRLSPGRYLWHRILRIGPGFWVCILVLVVVVGPIAYFLFHGTLRSYVGGADGAVAYLQHNFFLGIGQLGIKDIFRHTPYGTNFGVSYLNGSLWTIIYEFLAYLALAVVVYVGFRFFGRWIVPLLAVLAGSLEIATAVNPNVIGFLSPGNQLHLPVLGIISPLQLVLLSVPFLCGASIWLLREHIPTGVVLTIVALIVGIALTRTFLWGSLGTALLVYAFISLAYLAPKRLHSFGRRTDISYGVYLYGWPIQQSMVAAGALALGFWPVLIFSLLGAAILGTASWFLVEKPALKLKDIPLPIPRWMSRRFSRDHETFHPDQGAIESADEFVTVPPTSALHGEDDSVGTHPR
jgi:peptidoglycan/LPS O-acetylase OafA/YrhL